MGFLLIIGMVTLLAYLNAVIIRLFRRWQAGPGWWALLIAAWAVGMALGVAGGFFFEYRPLPELRVAGAPIPAAFSHREGPPGEERWVDFITPAPLLFAGSNVLILGLLMACPVGLVFWLPRRGTAGSRATRPAL
jgi:hypothetical protein